MKLENKLNTIIISLIILIFLAGCTGETAKQNKLEKISVRLPIPVNNAAFTFLFSAIDQGYYADEGLDVTFNFGSQETNPVKMVSSGVDEFAVLGGPDTLLVARSKGIPLKAFAIIHKDSNFPILVTLKESGLTKVKDLEGKKVGFFYGHISTDVMRNLFRKNNVNVEEINVGFDYNQLIQKKVDAQVGFWTYAPLVLAQKGIQTNIIQPNDYDITAHGYTLFGTEETLEKRPEVVEKFLRATFKGIQYTQRNPTQAIKSITNRAPNLDYELELEELYLYNEVTSNSEQYPAGYMDLAMFQETYDRLEQEGVIENSFDVKEAFTTEFLEKIHG